MTINTSQQTRGLKYLLKHELFSLGNIIPLELHVDYDEVERIISKYKEHFKIYNPRKEGYNRYGLSITSKDGGFSGIPDLDSLYEYNKENGTGYDEPDFREKTPFFHSCHSLKSALKPFHNFMGRSHILRLDKGGFFPPHRDMGDISFRLFISFSKIDLYSFILDEKKIFLQKNHVYCINTCLSHSLFSFENNNFFAVFNIDLSQPAVRAVFNHLLIK